MGFWNNSTNPGADMTQVLAGISQYYPQLAAQFNNASNSNIAPAAQANLSAEQAVSSPTNQLITSLYGTYGPQLAQIGSDIGKQTQQNQVNNNAGVANSAGGQAALAASIAADKAANPEYYATRANNSNALSTLLSNDTNALTNPLGPTVTRAIDQSIAQQGAQTGTVNTPSATQTTANAMRYGQAGYNQQEQAKSDLSAAIGQATSFLPQSQSQVGGMNAWNTATGGSSTSTNDANAAQGLFGGVTNTSGGANQSGLASIAGSTAGAAGSSFDSAIGANAGQSTGLGNALGINNGIATGANATSSNKCCYIVLEAYHGMMPTYVRKARDKYYSNFSNIVIGYKKVAEWLVPTMRKFPLVRSLVWHFNVHPATRYFTGIHTHQPKSKYDKMIVRFWLKTYNIIGKHYAK